MFNVMWQFFIRFYSKVIVPRYSACWYTEGNKLSYILWDSQFRRNKIFNSLMSKYMPADVNEYDDINRLTVHIMKCLILSPLAKTVYLEIARIVFC